MNARREPDKSEPEGYEPARFDRLASTMALRMGLALSGLDCEELWFRYLALGGSLSQCDLCAALDCVASVSTMEHNKAAHALNEHLMETMGVAYPVAYAAELDTGHAPY